MTHVDSPLSLVETLTDTEEAIARLYETFANIQPEHEEFWFGLVIQEADHANIVHQFIHNFGKRSSSFHPHVELLREIVALRDYLEQEKNKAKRENITFTDALRVAITIEESIVKKGLYTLLNDISGNAGSAITQLHHSNANHVKFLKLELEKYSKRG